MSWGTGGWGTAPWGTGEALPPPTLVAVTSEPGETAETQSPAVVAEKGGTILRVFGTNFFARDEQPYITVDILAGNPPNYTVVGAGYVFDPEFDIERNRIICGAPALVNGLYHVRVTTDGGISSVLENALAARAFADEFKTVSVRGKFGPKWATGPRTLKG